MSWVRKVVATATGVLVLGLAARDAAAQQTCATPKTFCAGHSGYYAASDDVDRLTAVADPILREVRTCLDANGAKHVPAVLVIRWDSEGKAVDVSINAPGYESLGCVQGARAKLAVLQNPHETAIRCELGCTPPAAAKPVPAPVVVPPPVTKQVPPPPQPAPTPPVVQQPPPPKPEQPRYEETWYGYQTITVDALSLGLLVAGTASRSGSLALGGYLGFLLGTPIVHMVHGNIGAGFGSMGLRFLVPLIGMGVGAVAGLIIGGTGGSGDLDSFGRGANGAISGLVIGGLIGTGGCILIDAAGFAYTKERVDDHASKLTPRGRMGLTVTPTLRVERNYAALGIGGRF